MIFGRTRSIPSLNLRVIIVDYGSVFEWILDSIVKSWEISMDLFTSVLFSAVGQEPWLCSLACCRVDNRPAQQTLRNLICN